MARHYPYYQYQQFDTVPSCIAGIDRLFSAKPALTFYSRAGEKLTHTYGEFCEDVRCIAASCRENGMAGAHVALAAESSYPFLVTMFALMTVGSVVVPLDIEQSDDIILRMLERADVTGAALTSTFVSLIPPHLKRMSKSFYIMLDETRVEEGFSFHAMLAQGRILRKSGRDVDADAQLSPDAPALIVFTSGTTSVSKPVLLSHRNILMNACQANALVSLGDKLFTALPMFHSYGFVCGVLAHITQGKHVCVNGSLKTMMRDMKLFSPVTITAVPLIAEAMHRSLMTALREGGKLDEYTQFLHIFRFFKRFGLTLKSPFRPMLTELFGKDLSMMVCGGAHMNAAVAMEMEAFGVLILQGYGITECSPLISVNRNKANKFESTGVPLPDTLVRIDDGEILVRSPSVMLGYYKDDDLTAACMEGGWFHTGDIGAVDRDGYVYIRGRKKHLIVFKNGKKVVPEEIEEYVSGIPLIKEAVAFGASIGDTSDDVRLALMVYPDPQVTRGMAQYEILQHLQKAVDALNRTLPAYKQIQVLRLRDTPFGRNGMQKIVRADLL